MVKAQYIKGNGIVQLYIFGGCFQEIIIALLCRLHAYKITFLYVLQRYTIHMYLDSAMRTQKTGTYDSLCELTLSYLLLIY